MSVRAPRQVVVVEPAHIPDIFISGIARIKKLDGGCVRLVLYAEQRGPDGKTENVVVCRIVRSVATWADDIQHAARVMAEQPLVAEDGKIEMLN